MPRILAFLGHDPRPEAKTIAGHLRRKREGLGQTNAETAALMGVDPCTWNDWERREDGEFDHRSVPVVITYLGFNPLPVPGTLGAYIRQLRYVLGDNQTEFGQRVGQSTNWISAWELGQKQPTQKAIQRILKTAAGTVAHPCPLYSCQTQRDRKLADKRFLPRSIPPEVTSSLGECIRRKRLELGLSQRALAERLGVKRNAVSAWERGLATPFLSVMPALFGFVGYCLYRRDMPLSRKIVHARHSIGLSQAEFGKLLGVSRESVLAWESGAKQPRMNVLRKLHNITESD